jgi:hypothetical protein
MVDVSMIVRDPRDDVKKGAGSAECAAVYWRCTALPCEVIMTLHEMLTKIPELTPQEQWLLLEALSRALRTTPTAQPGSAERLLGILAGGRELSDADLDDLRLAQLLEKHA